MCRELPAESHTAREEQLDMYYVVHTSVVHGKCINVEPVHELTEPFLEVVCCHWNFEHNNS